MDVKGIFFQTTFEADLAPMGVFGLRGRIEAPCPGREDNTVSLCLGEGCHGFRLKRPKNIGTCEGYVLYYDQSGTFIGCYVLRSGQAFSELNPPSSTFNVRFGCSPECGGSAVLEFDVTDIA
ncbi:MAG: hypothetical protein WAM53_16155 [Terrimicrobiaceae bacterium]